MNRDITQLFINEAEKIIEKNKSKKSIFVESIGYTLSSYNNVKKGTNVQFDNLLLFCKNYGFDLDYFIDHEKYIENAKKIITHKDDSSLKSKIDEIRLHFSALEKANNEIKSLLKHGLEITNDYDLKLNELKTTIGF
ncbi:hypothetical protein MPN29_02595 [Riemerella anatipestifer]|uniref:Uncharacterized protein n=1 Tax=Riemerella anatipestifer TaxID=34085 RepID=A0A1S7DUB1_RIEAN|nr:hypothetical protein [Riemerella anatipestifer]AQY22651.1 hypothetical protein AB406_1707 [Riemerella anatipestifer]MDD1549103.1 hypothetical protein [Riemerella anatipestifer]MDR7831925.1 hypothetical protein [Riemerella anatipestifer]MDY3402362.1 hypothetical protein [Riemerella anatipestifer]MRM84425.1 hypothetical protein [Riemerella anatipestifer]